MVVSEGGFEVHGGVYGVAADMEDMAATGRRLQQIGAELVEINGAAAKVLLDSNLTQSAVVAPESYASFQAAMALAVGPTGLAGHVGAVTAAGLFMRAQAKAYRATDATLTLAEGTRQWVEGYTLPVQAAARLHPAAWPANSADAWRLYQEGLFSDPGQWLVENPDDLESLVASAPGLVALLTPGVGFPGNVEQAAALLAGLYDQELGELTTIEEASTVAPTNIAEALARLDEVNGETGQFQIEQTGDSYTVYLPGTKKFDAPWAQAGLVQNMATNFAATAGGDNAYEVAVLQALQEALKDAPPDAEVNFVAHSQGGIVAMRLAERLTSGEGTQANVTSVLSAGAPVDHIDLPSRVQVVSLVNEYDIVPRLDGRPYGDKANHTTIVGRYQNDDVQKNHKLKDVYVRMAEQLTQADDPVIVAALAGFGGQHATEQVASSSTIYQMERN